MKKEIFCKIIELPTHQVLVYKECNADDDTYEVIPMVSLKNVTARLKIGFKKKKECDEYFNSVDEKISEEILKHLKGVVEI